MTSTVVPLRRTTPASQAVATEIRAEMGRAGLTQSALARRLGTSQPWISRRVSLTADIDLSVNDVVEMAKALEISPQRLLVCLSELPRLDSNQQPFVYPEAQVIDLATERARRGQFGPLAMFGPLEAVQA